MAVIERSASVPYQPIQMLTLVNDIEAYPEFLRWCQGARIESSFGDTVEAALDIGIRGIFRTMRTRNITTIADDDGSSMVRIEMIEGPLKKLAGEWTFSDRAQDGCDVVLTLEYEVHFSPLGVMLGAIFDEIANSQLNAFVRRAEAVYGGS